MRRLLLCLGIAALACNAGAVVLYKSIDANGRVTYSDQPPSGAATRVTPLEIDTSALPPCGYVIHLTAYDRTIVDCGTSWRDDDTVGFCLRVPAVQ